MYNAEETIGATLESVCAQSHSDLDIVVVDDGSTDASTSIVTEWAARDPRIRLIHQQNAGVAAARNRGAYATDASYLAFVDADDIWAVDKVKAQLELLINGEAPAIAYCWYVRIDQSGRSQPGYEWRTIEGDVLAELCGNYFVGNGSSFLMSRNVFEAVGGFDTSLRARNAQGCEDYLFALRAAEHYRFRVVRRHLVGYRDAPDSMSTDVWQMYRSFQIVSDEYCKRYPDMSSVWHPHLGQYLGWLVERSLARNRLDWAYQMYLKLLDHDRELARSKLRSFAVIWAANRTPSSVKTFIRGITRRRRPLYRDAVW